MVVRLTFETPLIFRRRPWMEARLSLVSSLGYTFNSFNSSPTLHSFTARATRQQTRSSSSFPVPVPVRQGERGEERSIIAARPPSPLSSSPAAVTPPAAAL